MMPSRASRLITSTLLVAAWLLLVLLLVFSRSDLNGSLSPTAQVDPLILAFDVAVVADVMETQVGDTVNLTYWITNTGNVIITSILVQRADVSSAASTSALVHPGEIMTGTIPVLVTIADWPGPMETGVSVVATGSNNDNLIKNSTIIIPLEPNQTSLPFIKRIRRRG